MAQSDSDSTATGPTVYVGSDADSLYALNAADGTEQWSVAMGGAVVSSPTVVGGTVYVGSDDGTLYALDAATGDQPWAYNTGSVIRSSPTVVDATVYVGTGTFNSTNNNLHAVDAATGDQHWVFDTGAGVRFSSPTVVNGTVYVGSDGDTLYAVDTATGDQQWEFNTADGAFSSPTVVNGTVYVGSYDGTLYALNAADGTEQQRFDTGEAVQSSPTVADGTVYVGSWDNTLYAVDVATGDQQWAFDTGGTVTSSPTVVDGTVYIGSQALESNNVYAVDAATGDQQWAFDTGGIVQSSPTVVTDPATGDSIGSRVNLGTLGHHHEWADNQSKPSKPEPSPGDRIEIQDWHDLDAVRQNLDGEYVFVNDLDRNTAGYDEHVGNPVKGWNPIGDVDRDAVEFTSFTGTIDGNGHKITGLEINRPDETDLGLFAMVGETTTIRDLTLADLGVTGKRFVGGFIGANVSGTVTKSSADGEVTGEKFVGGLIGKNSGELHKSSFRGTVTGEEWIGGLVGWNVEGAAVSESWVRGDVAGGVGVGGLIGTMTDDGGKLSESWVSGSVTGEDRVGALVGYNKNSEGDPVGEVSFSYWDEEVIGQTAAIGNDQGIGSGVTGLSTGEITGEAAPENMEALDFEETWQVVTDPDGYPVLQWQDVRLDGSQVNIDIPSIELSQTAYQADGQPIRIQVQAENAESVTVEAQYDGLLDSFTLSETRANNWEGTILLDSDPVPGTWIDLEFVATGADGTETRVTTYEAGEWFHESKNIGFYVFEDVLDAVVILTRFADDDPYQSGVLKQWERGRAHDINVYYGSQRGSNGVVGLRLTFIDNGGRGFQLPQERETYSEMGDPTGLRVPVRNYLRDVDEVVSTQTDVDLEDFDFWIGTHSGFIPELLGVYFANPSPRTTNDAVYAPGGFDTEEETDITTTYSTWIHEIGHAYGLEHLYEFGNVTTECVMGAGTRLGSPEPIRDVPPLSTPMRIADTLGLEMSDPVSGFSDWLDVRPIQIDTDWTEITVPVPALQSYGEISNQVRALAFGTGSREEMDVTSTFIPEFRQFLQGRDYAENTYNWGQGQGSVLLYEHDPPELLGSRALNVVENRSPQSGSSVQRLLSPADSPGPLRVNPAAEVDYELWFTVDEIEGTTASVTVQKRVPEPSADTTDSAGSGSRPVVRAVLRDYTVLPDDLEIPAFDDPFTRPTLDLKAVDEEERIVGLNNAGEYVTQIPGSRASGRRIGGSEWITVPADADVEFHVSNANVETFLNELLSTGVIEDEARVAEIREEMDAEYEITVTEYGPGSEVAVENGQTTVTDTRRSQDGGTVSPGETNLAELDRHEGSSAEDTNGEESFGTVGPAVGIGAGISAAVGAAYVLKRRLGGEERDGS